VKSSNEVFQSYTAAARLPIWLRVSGVLVLVCSVAFGVRIIWEKTVWTWEYGPQMVGFSLAHGSGALLLLSPILLIFWTAIVVILTLLNLMKRNRISSARWSVLALVAFLLIVMELPEGFWQRVFIGRMAASPRAGDLLLYAAYRGDLGTVRALLSRGVPVDATDHAYRRTAMHGAAAKGDLPILRYLISKGGNVNFLDRYGDSPLELAASANRTEAIKFLTESGAKQIRGDDAQRKKAVNDQVKEDIEELNRSEAADKDLQEDMNRVTRDEEIQRNHQNNNSQ